MRKYRVRDYTEKGRKKKRIQIIYKGVLVIDRIFNPEDEKAVIKSVDMQILKDRLPYETHIIKPIKK